MDNPYEAPQTIDKQLPVASIVDAPPPPPSLMPGLQAMVEAGRLLLLAALFLPAAILSIFLVQWLGRDWRILQVLIMTLGVSSFVLCLYGFFKNLFGYMKLVSALPEGDEFRILYGYCQFHSWLRVFAVVLLFLVPTMRISLTDELLWGGGAVVWLMLLHPAWLHLRALRWWSARLGVEVAPEARVFYLVLMILGATLLLLAMMLGMHSRRDPSPLMICLALLLLAVAYGVYARMYRLVIEAIVSERYEARLLRDQEES